MKKTGVGLRATIVLTITLVMCITMLLISFVVLTTAKKNLLDQKITTGEIIITFLQQLIPVSLIAGDYSEESPDTLSSRESTINRVLRDFPLKNLIVVDSSLTIRASPQKRLIGQKSMDADVAQALSSGHIIKTFNTYQGRECLSLSAPLYQENEIEGVLQVTLPLSDVEESLATFQQTVVLFTLTTAFAFIIIGSFLLTRYLVKPLERLIQVTEDIGKGYVPQDLEPSGLNEIGTLSTSLSRMADKLREDRKRIEHYIHSLEETNRQLKVAQDEVVRSEKLASVGKLAAGIAHEIGNPIGIILGYLEILRHTRGAQEEHSDALKRIENELMRIDKIIRELLYFSHPRKASLHPVSVNSLIKEAVSLISHQKAFSTIHILEELPEGLPLTMADEQQFQQVMINLFINAMDAMPRGGTLTITSAPYHGPIPLYPRTSNVAGVKITVRDTGIGIKKENLTMIFDPFFTTKAPGKGTGLGLSVCVRIIESFKGIITVESSPGKGTTFAIILPAHHEEKAKEA